MAAEVPPVAADSREPQFTRAPGVTSFSLVVWGEPKPKARPRITRNPKTGFMHAYTPESTLSWEETVAWNIRQALTTIEVNNPGALAELPWTGRILMNLRFNMRRPTSAPKKVHYPLKGADIDNLAKSILDASQKMGLVRNDSTVTDVLMMKRFEEPGHPMGVEIEFTHFDG